MSEGPTRWGILSAGGMSRDFTKMLTSRLPVDHKVVAVAARKQEDAEAFADKFNIPQAYGGYKNLETDVNVEIVYIGTIHPHQAEQSKRMLRAGKHVLCEKPVTMNSRELEEVLAVAKETGKFFMGGWWSVFTPGFRRLKEVLSEGLLGDVKVVTAQFCLPSFHIARCSERRLGGGAISNYGCYCVMLADFVLGPKKPESVSATAIMTGGVDETISVTLTYPGKKMAVLTSSVNSSPSRGCCIVGSKGLAELDYVYAPIEIRLPTGVEHYPYEHNHPEYWYPGTLGLIHEAQAVRKCLVKGLKEPPELSHADTLRIMNILDEIRRQIGISDI